MNALVVGGSNGIGLSIVLCLIDDKQIDNIYVIDKCEFPTIYTHDKIKYISMDLTKDWDITKYGIPINDINALYITAGFGHLDHFQNFDIEYIKDSFNVNTISPILILKQFYSQLLSNQIFNCAVMVSIAGRLNSPLFSIYSATKAALSKCIEALNTELEMQGSENRILDVSPGSLKGTSFTGGISDPKQNIDLAKEIIIKSKNKKTLFIPQYDEVYKEVINRYQSDSHLFGIDSYNYKLQRKNENIRNKYSRR